MSVNVLLRGQSNAQLFTEYGAVWEMEAQLEQKLGNGTDIHILFQWGDSQGRNTINSGSAFLDWDTDGKQAGFINYVNALPESVQDDPTVTLWMHNEFDMINNPATADWVREVSADAVLVRGALGQGAATTPYLFTWVPFPEGQGTANIQAGMRQLASDASLNAELALNAMDGDGHPNSWHMGAADAMVVAGRLATALEPLVREVAGSQTPPPTGSGGTGTGGTGTGGGAPTTASVGSGSDTLVLSISQDAYQGSAQYAVSVDDVQIGGTQTASALHGSGQADTVTVRGDWAAGNHTATVNFLNDAWAGTPATDRNLYVESGTYNTADVSGAARELFSAGPASFDFQDPLI